MLQVWGVWTHEEELSTGARTSAKTTLHTVREGKALCERMLFSDRRRRESFTVSGKRKFGIPRSSTGQAIIERTHHTLKSLLDRQKRGEPEATPHMKLNKALYVLNFLNSSSSEPNPPILRYFSNSSQAKLSENPLVLIRNPESGQIEGPFRLITWGKGFACVSTGRGLKWVSVRHVKPFRTQERESTDPRKRETSTQTEEEAQTASNDLEETKE